MNTLLQDLARRAEETPNKAVLQPLPNEGGEEHSPLSASQLASAAAGVATKLGQAGVSPGDRVLLCGSNRAEIAAGYFGCHEAGAIAVPVAPEMPAELVTELAAQSGARLALLESPVALSVPSLPLLETVDWNGDSQKSLGASAKLDTPADLLFTTGTSGAKKGVLLTHGCIAHAATNINAFLTVSADDREMVPVPLSHSFGLGRLRCSAQAGHLLILEPGLRNPAKSFKRLLALEATGFAMVPAGLAILKRFVRKKLAKAAEQLKYIEIGSAPLGAPEREWLLEHLPHTRICHHYGLTEASRSAFTELHTDAHKPGSIGRPTPNVQIEIRLDGGDTAPPGEAGELWVRGGMVMSKYWDNPELTARTLQDGWLRTGDVGRKDEDGFLYLLGRRKDVINVGGLKYSPHSIEQALEQHPDVEEAACVGAPDPDGISGQVVRAFLVASKAPDAKELTGFLRDKLEESAIPKSFEQVAQLPKTASGKLQRWKLLETEEEL